MMLPVPYVNSSFLNNFGTLVIEKGGDFRRLCEKSSIPLASLTGNPVPIPFLNFILLLENSAKELDFPEISFALANRQDITILGPLAIMLEGCESFSEAINIIHSYLNILVSGIDIKFIKRNGLLEIVFIPSLPNLNQYPQFQFYLLASATKIIKELSQNRYAIRGLFFTLSETNKEIIKRYSQELGSPIAFNQLELKISLDSGILNEPIKDIQNYITSKMRTFVDSQGVFLDQVTTVISIFLPSGKASIENVSQSMGYSSRTLQRKLKEASTSFKKIIDSVRLDHANQLLKNTSHTLTDIAVLLGYSNLSAFSRAYYRWYGIYPKSARVNQLEKNYNF